MLEVPLHRATCAYLLLLRELVVSEVFEALEVAEGAPAKKIIK